MESNIGKYVIRFKSIIENFGKIDCFWIGTNGSCVFNTSLEAKMEYNKIKNFFDEKVVKNMDLEILQLKEETNFILFPDKVFIPLKFEGEEITGYEVKFKVISNDDINKLINQIKIENKKRRKKIPIIAKEMIKSIE